MNRDQFFNRRSFMTVPILLMATFKPMPVFAQESGFWYFTTTDTNVMAQSPLGTTVCALKGNAGSLTHNNGTVEAWYQKTTPKSTELVFDYQYGQTVYEKYIIDSHFFTHRSPDTHVFIGLADQSKQEILNPHYRKTILSLANQLTWECRELFITQDLDHLKQEIPSRTAGTKQRINFDTLDEG